MKADRYEREREKVRASKMPAHLKLARLFHIDMREERLLERRIKSDGKKLNALRDRVAKEREAREREQARAELPHLANQREQNAAAVSPSPAAASPFSQVGVFALAAIAHIPVPKVVKQ